MTASDVSHGKPGPEPYVWGASLLGLSPADCIVVEDATAGLVSGRAARAGLVVAVLGTTTVEVLARDADVVVDLRGRGPLVHPHHPAYLTPTS